MAYTLKEIGKTPNNAFHHFVCDDEEDLPTIDVSHVPWGSTCYVINQKKDYILNSEKQWKSKPNSTPVNPDDGSEEEIKFVEL